jgi:hypothetical protein
VIAALGMGALVASVTVPWIVPVDCAKRGAAKTKTTTAAAGAMNLATKPERFSILNLPF